MTPDAAALIMRAVERRNRRVRRERICDMRAAHADSEALASYLDTLDP